LIESALIPSPKIPPAPTSKPFAGLVFDNSYARELEGLYVAVTPATVPSPKFLKLNLALAESLGLDASALNGPEGLAVLSGNQVPSGAQPIAQAYAGHQFGGFSPQLGDGRALLLGEIMDRQGRRRDIAFKGSGRTPFSRGGDGKAAIGPVLREYLMGEGMHALGIPTTRVLAAVATGEQVRRETALPGALLSRVASSHLRVGTFQYFAARRDQAMLRRLADYAIARHDPELVGRDDRFIEFFKAVVQRQASLIAQWMSVGFIHGVMNTDNMTISGETIDYGPCAFMEGYNPDTVFSSIDHYGRYAYGRQPDIAQWNLARLAESLLELIDTDADRATKAVIAVLEDFPRQYAGYWLQLNRNKLGWDDSSPPSEDTALIHQFLGLMQTYKVDYTQAMRYLADVAEGETARFLDLFGAVGELEVNTWVARWQARLRLDAPGTSSSNSASDIAKRMRAKNPIYIPRNHLVEAALQAASDRDDLVPFERLLQVLQDPFTERPEYLEFSLPAAAELTAVYQTYCGT
jgi:serine/tyrosine/threonine adenylyltransferase